MKLDEFYMNTADKISENSYCKRLKVGAVIVTKNGAMFPGFNGTLPGFPNICEIDENTTNEAITVHAEQNALYKMLKEGVSADGATIYVTHSPCEQCVKMMISCGISRVVYKNEYRITTPIDTLKDGGVEVVKIG